jgi:hypothetical protein
MLLILRLHMLLFYRRMVLVSSRSPFNPRLFLTHPVTRSTVAEAFIVHLATTEPPDRNERYVQVTKSDMLKVLLRLDPRASPLSLDRAWPEFVERVTYYGQTWSTSNGNDGVTLQFDRNLIQYVSQRVAADVAGGVFLGMDERDPALRHLFEEDEPPILPPVQPRMDVEGRLMTTADDKLDQLVRVVEQLIQIAEPDQRLLYRVLEEQRATAIVAQQNKLAIEDVEIKIEQLMESQRLRQSVTGEEMTMAEKLVKAATETSTGVLSAIQEGGKISLSQKANKGVVEVFHKHLGHHIPGATSPVGKKIEALAIPSILHFGAAMLADKVPHVDVIQRACLRAITGESKDGMDGIVEALMPVFKEILAGEGIVGEAMKQMSSAEPQIAATSAPPQLSASEAQALMASFLEQMKNAPPGEPVEIKLTLPARTAEPRPLVPPFES